MRKPGQFCGSCARPVEIVRTSDGKQYETCRRPPVQSFLVLPDRTSESFVAEFMAFRQADAF